MATARSLKIVFASATVYATTTGLKNGARAKVQDPKEFVQPLPKSARRQLRKALQRAGRTDLVMATL